MSNDAISRDVWLSALADTIQPVEERPDALTKREFAAKFKLPYQAASRRIEGLVAEGRLRQVSKRALLPGGQIRLQQAYVLVTASKAKAGRRHRGTPNRCRHA